MYKFRSMYADAEDRLKDLLAQNEMDGPAFKIKIDPRITRVGHFIRKTSIDELPQLWNILKGDMSIVGPRPALPRDVRHARPDLLLADPAEPQRHSALRDQGAFCLRIQKMRPRQREKCFILNVLISYNARYTK
jgi:hypothetical protein